jgi:ribosomal protein L40E
VQPLTLSIPEEAPVLTCGDCNARNNDGERFCSNCGAYLVWQQAPADAAEQRPDRTAGSGLGPAVTTAQLPEVAPPSDPSHAPASFGATASANPAHGDVLEERQPRQADGRTPREPEPRPRRGEAPPIPGGLTCRRCGADNKPEGSFCRQCGASLKEAAVVPIPPWWQQLLGRTKPAALPAGTRPRWRKQRGISAGTVSLLTVMGLFAGVAYAGREVIVTAVLRAVDEILEKPVPPQKMTASNFAPGRDPDRARDGSAVDSWASDGPGDGPGAYLEASFDRSFRLTYVVIDGGASSVKQDFDKERRPAKVEIVAFRDDGSHPTLTVDVADVSGSQNFYVGADGVKSVRLNILETKGPPGARVSVAEVRFAGRFPGQ